MTRHLGKELHQTANKIRRQIDRISLAHGLTGLQGIVLDYLLRREGPTLQRDIEQDFDIRRSTVSKMLALLEKDGFIYRESVAGDARQRRVAVTEKGRAVHSAVGVEVNRYERRVLDSLNPVEQELFFALLDRVADAAEMRSGLQKNPERERRGNEYAGTTDE